MILRIFALFIYLISAPLIAKQCTLNIGWMERPNYQYRGLDGEPKGFDIEAAKIISRNMKCKANFVYMPWQRQMKEWKAGELDLLLGAISYKFPELNKNPFRSDPVGFYWTRSAAEKFGNANSLTDMLKSGLRLGVLKRSYRSEELYDLMKNKNFKKNILIVRSLRGLLNNLINGHLDGIYMRQVELDSLSKFYNLDNININEKFSYNSNVYILLSPKSSQHAQKLEESIKHFQTTNQFKSLQDRLYPQKNVNLSPLK